MKNKYKTLVVLALLILPLVMSAQDEIVKTKIQVRYDNVSDIFYITGENLEWSKSVRQNMTIIGFEDELDVILIRKFANLTEVSDLLELCKENLNFTQEWQDCIDLNRELSIFILDKTVNKTDYEMCQSNLSYIEQRKEIDYNNLNNEKSEKIEDLEEDLQNMTTWRNWSLFGALGLGVVSFYLANKYKVWQGQKSFKERDIARDLPF